MQNRARHLISLAFAALLSSFAGTALASDHIDSPNISKDPSADITDLYAFASPDRPGRLVLAMNLHPGAPANAKFSDAVTYSIRVRPDDVAVKRELRIDCTFDSAAAKPDEQLATCTAYGFDTTSRRVFARIGGTAVPLDKPVEVGGMRIFAGRRADPFGVDAKGAGVSIRGDRWAFKGENALAGLDVLSIVVELEVARFFKGATTSRLVRVAGETTIRVKS